MTRVDSMGGDTAADFTSGDGSGETLAPKPYVLSDVAGPLSRDELVAIDAWWRAANYLAVGQIYLLDNPLLREPLQPHQAGRGRHGGLFPPILLPRWGAQPLRPGDTGILS